MKFYFKSKRLFLIFALFHLWTPWIDAGVSIDDGTFEAYPESLQKELKPLLAKASEMFSKIHGNSEKEISFLVENTFTVDTVIYQNQDKGIVRLSLGLLENISSDDELAYVLSRTSVLLDQDMRGGSVFTSRQFKDALEVDRLTIKKMIDSGYNPHVGSSFIEDLTKMSGLEKSRLNASAYNNILLKETRIEGQNQEFRLDDKKRANEIIPKGGAIDKKALENYRLRNLNERLKISATEVFDDHYKSILSFPDLDISRSQDYLTYYAEEVQNTLNSTKHFLPSRPSRREILDIELKIHAEVDRVFNEAREKFIEKADSLTTKQMDAVLELDRREFHFSAFERLYDFPTHVRDLYTNREKLQKEKDPEKAKELKKKIKKDERILSDVLYLFDKDEKFDSKIFFKDYGMESTLSGEFNHELQKIFQNRHEFLHIGITDFRYVGKTPFEKGYLRSHNRSEFAVPVDSIKNLDSLLFYLETNQEPDALKKGWLKLFEISDKLNSSDISEMNKLSNVLDKLRYGKLEDVVNSNKELSKQGFGKILDALANCSLDQCRDLESKLTKTFYFDLEALPSMQLKLRQIVFDSNQEFFNDALEQLKNMDLKRISNDLLTELDKGMRENLTLSLTKHDKTPFVVVTEEVMDDFLDKVFSIVKENSDTDLNKKQFKAFLKMGLGENFDLSNATDRLENVRLIMDSLKDSKERAKVHSVFDEKMINAVKLHQEYRLATLKNGDRVTTLKEKLKRDFSYDKRPKNRIRNWLFEQRRNTVQREINILERASLEESLKPFKEIYPFLDLSGSSSDFLNPIFEDAIKEGSGSLPRMAKIINENGDVMVSHKDITSGSNPLYRYLDKIFQEKVDQHGIRKGTFEFWKELGDKGIHPLYDSQSRITGQADLTNLIESWFLDKTKDGQKTAAIDLKFLRDYGRGVMDYTDYELKKKVTFPDSDDGGGFFRRTRARTSPEDRQLELRQTVLNNRLPLGNTKYMSPEYLLKNYNNEQLAQFIKFQNDLLWKYAPELLKKDRVHFDRVDQIFERLWEDRANPIVASAIKDPFFIQEIRSPNNAVKIGKWISEEAKKEGKTLSEALSNLNRYFPDASLAKDEILANFEKIYSPNRRESKILNSFRLSENTKNLDTFYDLSSMLYHIDREIQSPEKKLDLVRYLTGLDDSFRLNEVKASRTESLAQKREWHNKRYSRMRKMYQESNPIIKTLIMDKLVGGEEGILSEPNTNRGLKSIIFGEQKDHKVLNAIYDSYMDVLPRYEKDALTSGILASIDPNRGGKVSPKRILSAGGPLGAKISQSLVTSGIAKGEMKIDLMSSFDDFLPPNYEDLYHEIESSFRIGEELDGGRIKEVKIERIAGSGSINASAKASIILDDGRIKTTNIKFQKANVSGLIENENMALGALSDRLAQSDDGEIRRMGRIINELREGAYHSLRPTGVELNLLNERNMFEKANVAYSTKAHPKTGFRIEASRPDLETQSFVHPNRQKEVSVFEHVEATKLEDIEDPILRKNLASQIIDAELAALDKGVFDPDGHPGNWLIDLENKRIVRIDYAQLHEFKNPKDPQVLKEMMRILSLPNKDKLVKELPQFLHRHLDLLFTIKGEVPNDFKDRIKNIISHNSFPDWTSPPERILSILEELEAGYQLTVDENISVKMNSGPQKYIGSYIRMNAFKEQIGGGAYLKKMANFLEMDEKQFYLPAAKNQLGEYYKGIKRVMNPVPNIERTKTLLKSCLPAKLLSF